MALALILVFPFYCVRIQGMLKSNDTSMREQMQPVGLEMYKCTNTVMILVIYLVSADNNQRLLEE